MRKMVEHEYYRAYLYVKRQNIFKKLLQKIALYRSAFNRN